MGPCSKADADWSYKFGSWRWVSTRQESAANFTTLESASDEYRMSESKKTIREAVPFPRNEDFIGESHVASWFKAYQKKRIEAGKSVSDLFSSHTKPSLTILCSNRSTTSSNHRPTTALSPVNATWKLGDFCLTTGFGGSLSKYL
jgi:hypothetical protein